MLIGRPRYLVFPLLCAAFLAAAAGCDKAEPTAAPTIVTTLTTPSPTAAQTQAQPPTQSPKAAPTTAAAYPAQARAYAEAVIAAWKAKDLARLGDLTSPQVHEQLIEIPGPPNMAWVYQMCDGAAGSQYCHFTNADGHKLILRMVSEKLGQPRAATEVKYEM